MSRTVSHHVRRGPTLGPGVEQPPDGTLTQHDEQDALPGHDVSAQEERSRTSGTFGKSCSCRTLAGGCRTLFSFQNACRFEKQPSAKERCSVFTRCARKLKLL